MYLQNVLRRCFLTVLSDILFLSDFPISKLLTDQITLWHIKEAHSIKMLWVFFFSLEKLNWDFCVRGDPHRALNIKSWRSTLWILCLYIYHSTDLFIWLEPIPSKLYSLSSTLSQDCSIIHGQNSQKSTITTFCGLSIVTLKHSPEWPT